MRLIDADELKEQFAWSEVCRLSITEINQIINDAPTVEYIPKMCKTCKYYHPYYVQFSDVTRGDGYCQIARMTPEGMTTINCNDYFGCEDYEKRS